MFGLIEIQSFIQQLAEAMAAVLRIEVTVFDVKLTRIAGTGRHKKDIGKRRTPSSMLAKVIEENCVVCVFNPVTDQVCTECQQKDECHEVANISYPIECNDRVIGLISLVAFSEKQRLKLIREKDEYIRFLGKMAELISSKLYEHEKQVELEQYSLRMANIVSSLPDGVLVIDDKGNVLSHNHAALETLRLTKEELQERNFKDIDPTHPVWETLATGQTCFNQEIVWEYQGKERIRYLCSTYPMSDGSKIVSAIVFLKSLKSIRRIYNELAGPSEHLGFNTIVGAHSSLKSAITKAKKAASSDSTIVIQGESGTGKELFARAIHGHSKRKDGAFVAINCAAIPETLLESELFGYEGGAFTGARAKGKMGKFELASGGTIFLDEIGDMQLSMQAKLLRVLEDKQVTRLGGVNPIPVNVRVIAATHRNLEAMVAQGEFREDLFYRLSVIPIKIPPLRDRKTDIPILIDSFLEEFKLENPNKKVVFSQEAMDILLQYHWPGNVRELKNVVEYAYNMVDGKVITVEHIPERVRASVKNQTKQNKTIIIANGLVHLEEVERLLLKKGLEYYGTNEQAKGEIAKQLGISKATVYRKLKKYGLG